MSAENLFERERSALARLKQLVADRAAAEGRIGDSARQAADEAEKEVQRARRVIAAGRHKAKAEAETAHQEALAAIVAEFRGEQTAADRKRAEDRRRVTDKGVAAEEQAKAEHRDRLWTIDSLLEAGEKEAEDNRQKLHRRANAAAEQVGRLWVRVGPLLDRVRLTREEVETAIEVMPSATDTDPVGKLDKCLEDADRAAERVERAFLPKLLGTGPLAVLVALAAAIGAGVGAAVAQGTGAAVGGGVGAVLGALLVWFGLGYLARRQVRDRTLYLGVFLAETARAADRLREYADDTHRQEKVALARRHANDRKRTDDHYKPLIKKLQTQLKNELERVDGEHAEASDRNRAEREAAEAAEARRFEKAVADGEAKFDAELKAAEDRYARKTADAAAARDRDWGAAARAWQTGLTKVRLTLTDLTAAGEADFPAWSRLGSDSRPLATTVPAGIRYGELAVDLHALPDGEPADERLKPADPLSFRLPAYLPFPDKAAVLLKAHDAGRPAAVAALQAMMLRFLTGLPPGKVRFTIIDPVGLGDNFAAFMHLADYDENLVGARIWTEPSHIEKRLADLTAHMEDVIQKYLRNQYKSIEEYNRAAGEVAEPYRVLVVANFPANFTPEAARRLVSILSSGPSCGVCTLLSVDTKAAMPRDFRLADLEQVALNLVWKDGKFEPQHQDLQPFKLTLDPTPDAATVAKLVRRVGASSKDANRVEVPFEYVAPKPDGWWAGTAAKGFEVPIGRAGATRKQVFAVGRGTAQHALVAGKTGSGKSTLLHALITNLALMYSPDEAELYLIDFKKGVEFKPYAQHRLPHARVVAIESEREFGLSVLQRLDGVLRERGDKFRDAGVNNLGEYREATGERCPRILLVVDEFQEFFVEDDKLSQEAALLLDRLVRQGRAFGLHVLLGSQTLGGAYSLARSTIDQMAVRIALQCSEADAQLILSKDNSAARLLSRPGEAIYNDANGLIEGNDPFQVVWLSDDKREDVLAELQQKADGKAFPPPIVFEGSESADVRKNGPLARVIEAPPAEVKAPVAWLGDPVAIKEPTAAVFRSQSAANLLLIGQQEAAALALMTVSLAGLAAQLPAGPGTFTVLDGTPDDADHADYLRKAAATLGLAGAVADRGGVAAAVGAVAGELDRRQKGETADRSPRFLFVHGLQRFRELRKPEDDYGFGRKGDKAASPGEQFAAVLRDGPPLGIHTIVWVDTLTNLTRALDRQGLKEFGMRVLFQMSAADSSHLTDSPMANRLARGRALYVQEELERPEKFRPYGLPEAEWLKAVGEKVAGREAVGA